MINYTTNLIEVLKHDKLYYEFNWSAETW
jgi:hypothetical protein